MKHVNKHGGPCTRGLDTERAEHSTSDAESERLLESSRLVEKRHCKKTRQEDFGYFRHLI